MSAALFVLKSEVRRFEKTQNLIHLAHAHRALSEVMDELRNRSSSPANEDGPNRRGRGRRRTAQILRRSWPDASRFLKIATYNVNGVNCRLEGLLRWLKDSQPDIACLQELKAPDEKFPRRAFEQAGYTAIWHGQKSWNGVAILARGAAPIERRRGLPGDPDDTHSRYIEAEVHGLILGCLYLPNGNPAPGPKFDYKLRWFKRLSQHARGLLKSGKAVVLVGDYNVMPTELDVYAPERWVDDALFRPEVRRAYRKLVEQGWTDAIREQHPGERIYTFWKYWRNAFKRDAGLRIDHFLLSPSVAKRLKATGVDREVRERPGASDHAPAWIEISSTTAPPRHRSRAT